MEKLWLKNYPEGVPATISTDHRTLNDLFDDVCNKYPENRAITCNSETITFAQTQNYVRNFAASLIELGIQPRDRVAVIMPNVMQYPLVVFAIMKIGAIVVNINPLYTEAEIDYLLENSGAKAVVVLDMMANKLNSLYNKHSVEHVIVTKVPDLYPFIKRNILNFAIKNIKRVNVSYAYKAHDFREMVVNDKQLKDKVSVSPEDIAFIQFTGATTGKPKGAMLLHRSIVANLDQINLWLGARVPDLDKQIAIGALPLYHIFSLTANLFTFFFNGSENIMIPNPRDVPGLVKVLTKYPFTVFSALDTLYNHLLNSEEFTKHKYPSFKYSVAGGMPIRESVAYKWQEVTGVLPSNCYGLTEASPAVTMNVFGDPFDGSVGYPIPSTEIEIRNIDTQKEVAQGEIGVVWIRGPQMMKAYWNNPEQTAAAHDVFGWFNTKDLGYISPEGKLFLSGRQSELIIVSGFNVYPAEVEGVLDSIPGIKESAVIGLPDEATGEAVVGFIVLKPGNRIQEKEIIENCRLTLARYKVPKHIHIIDELPKTLVGKIDKVALAKNYLKK